MGKKIRLKRATIKEAENIRNDKKHKNKILCIVLSEGKGSSWVWLPDTQDSFSLNDNTYFRLDAGTYIKGLTRLLVYLEGISVPIHHGHIDHEEKTVEIVNRDTGKTEKRKFKFIKGLKFDSKVIDIILNRKIADEFTKTHMDLPNLVLVVLSIICVIEGIIIGYGVYA